MIPVAKARETEESATSAVAISVVFFLFIIFLILFWKGSFRAPFDEGRELPLFD
jgi:hypothetical protein